MRNYPEGYPDFSKSCKTDIWMGEVGLKVQKISKGIELILRERISV